MKNFLKKPVLLGGMLVFFIPFFVYILTLAPTISPGDGPELIAAAYKLGVAHQPGYPLLTLLSKFFIEIFPFGSVAWRVNLLNAIFGALTALVVYLIIFRLTKKIVPSLAGSLFLAFSSAFWLYSITAEVFALHHLLAAVLIFLLLIWREKILLADRTADRYLYLFCFVCGLAFANQEAIVFLGPAFLFLLLATKKEILVNPKKLLLMSIFLLLGLSFYLYLPLATNLNQSFHWGEPDTLRKMAGAILRENYGGVPFGPQGNFLSIWKMMVENFEFYFKSLYIQFTAVGAALGVFGLSLLFKDKKLFAFFTLAFLSSGLLLLFYLGNLKLDDRITRAVGERFTILPMVVFAIFIGYGIHFLAERLGRVFQNRGLLKRLALVFLSCSFLFPLFLHYPFVDQSQNTLLYDFGQDILSPADKNSLIISLGDMMFFSTLYLQEVEGVRTDVKVVQERLLTSQWYIDYLRKRHPDIKIPFERVRKGENWDEKLKELIAANIEKTTVYYPIVEVADKLRPDYFLLQRDFLFQVFKGEPPFSPQDYIRQSHDFNRDSRVAKNKKLYQAGFNLKYPFSAWDTEIASAYVISHYNKCVFFYNSSFFKEAEKECRLAEAADPSFEKAYFTLGNIAYKNKQYEEAARNYEIAIELYPGELKAYENLIVILSKHLNDPEKALEYTEKYLQAKSR
ncbi:MAG: DUF2723 domain-containing protein [bacterium]|nr:DUF2723 domain-containing protein [bacterium]